MHPETAITGNQPISIADIEAEMAEIRDEHPLLTLSQFKGVLRDELQHGNVLGLRQMAVKALLKTFAGP